MDAQPLWLLRTLAISAVMLAAGSTFAQNYPSKPIRIVTGEPGGGGDFTVRLIAPGLISSMGQQVIVENRGGSVVISAEIVAKSLPDGHTLLFFGGSFWTVPFLRASVPYDLARDFLPISLVQTSPNVLVIHPSLPVKSVKDLIALAKAKPGQLNYASTGTGSSNHLSAELLRSMANVDIVRINYKGSAPAINDLIGGQVQMMFIAAISVAQHVKSGRLRALAVTSAQPSALLPSLPTVAATGLPGYESTTITGYFAPAGTPTAIINRLNQEIVILKMPEIRERLFNAGSEAVGSSPEAFAAVIAAEMAKWGKVIKEAGIREE